MGGIGSGRNWHYGSKDTSSDHRSIDVRCWQRSGLLTPEHSFVWRWSRNGKPVVSIQVRAEADRVFLTYRHRSGGGEWKDESYPVWLDWTPCNFSGERPWFLCLPISCGRRVATLYGGDPFACRHCYQLAYPSSHRYP